MKLKYELKATTELLLGSNNIKNKGLKICSRFYGEQLSFLWEGVTDRTPYYAASGVRNIVI